MTKRQAPTPDTPDEPALGIDPSSDLERARLADRPKPPEDPDPGPVPPAS